MLEETVGISTPRVQSGINYSKSMFEMYESFYTDLYIDLIVTVIWDILPSYRDFFLDLTSAKVSLLSS